jgi:hypothetical protein
VAIQKMSLLDAPFRVTTISTDLVHEQFPGDPPSSLHFVRIRIRYFVDYRYPYWAELIFNDAIALESISVAGKHDLRFDAWDAKFLQDASLHRVDGGFIDAWVTTARIGPHSWPCLLVGAPLLQQKLAGSAEQENGESTVQRRRIVMDVTFGGNADWLVSIVYQHYLLMVWSGSCGHEFAPGITRLA